MGIIRRVWQTVLFGNIYIAICASATCLQTNLLLKGSLGYSYAGFVFFSTWFLYAFQRLFLSKQYDESHFSLRRTWIVNNRNVLMFFCCISTLGMGYLLFVMQWVLFYPMVVIGLLAASYFLPGLQLRKVLFVKNIVLAGVWAIVGVAMPVYMQRGVNEAYGSWYIVACLFLERFLFVSSLCTLFNIRDMEFDATNNVRTIPSVYGIKPGKVVAIASLTGSLICSSFLYSLGFYNSPVLVALFLSVCITMAIIYRTTAQSTESFFLFTVDGMIGLQALLVFIAFSLKLP